jgi:N-acetylglutamate synthase-like GNAT family acetyltransferase
MDAPIFIRKATEKDVRAICALIRRNAEVVLSRDYSRDQLNAWKRYNTPARLRQRMAERTSFCAFRGRRLCGTIALEGNELVGLYVSPASRGKGIGILLLAHLECFAATQGIARLHLTSTPSALSFYLRNGWHAGRTVVLTIMGVDFAETFMSKRLNRRNARRESP